LVPSVRLDSPHRFFVVIPSISNIAPDGSGTTPFAPTKLPPATDTRCPLSSSFVGPFVLRGRNQRAMQVGERNHLLDNRFRDLKRLDRRIDEHLRSQGFSSPAHKSVYTSSQRTKIPYGIRSVVVIGGICAVWRSVKSSTRRRKSFSCARSSVRNRGGSAHPSWAGAKLDEKAPSYYRHSSSVFDSVRCAHPAAPRTRSSSPRKVSSLAP
jgi:hypothetical protein